MTKWVIKAWSPDGSIQEGEYESQFPARALSAHQIEYPARADDWTNIDIDRAEE